MTDKHLEKVYIKALKLLSYRPRSINEIKFRLKKYTDSESLINNVINKLIKDNLLNDKEFAKWWVEQRKNNKFRGNIAITSELKQKGIEQSLINKVLFSAEEEKELAKKVIQKKKKKFKNLSKYNKKNKALQYLKSRGFTYQNIYSVIDELFSKE